MRFCLQAGFLLFAICIQTSGAAGCEIGNGQLHRPQPDFQFTTFSEQFSQGALLATTCIRNESNGDMEVRWLVPGPWGWIPEGEHLPRTRPVTGSDPRPLSGCLQYGNLGEMTIANFFGDADEFDQVDRESEIGCEEARNEFASRGGPSATAAEGVQSLEVPIRLFFPSNPETPRETMLLLEGFVGLASETPDSFGIFFGLELSQYEGRTEGDPSAIRVVSSFPDYMETIAPSVVQTISQATGASEGMPLQGLNEVFIFLELGNETVSLDEIFLEVISENGQQVARFGVPVFFPSE